MSALPHTQPTPPPLHFEAGGLIFERATREDEPTLRRLVASFTFKGAMSVGIAREPDYFACVAADGDPARHCTFVVRDGRSRQLLGMGVRSVHSFWSHGTMQRVGYLGLLRLATQCPLHRSALMMTYVRACLTNMSFIEAIKAPDEAPFELVATPKTNMQARRIFERVFPDMPTCTGLAEFHEFVYATSRQRRFPASVSVATVEDLPDILALLKDYHRPRALAPALTAERLAYLMDLGAVAAEDFLIIRSAGKLQACAAVLDLRRFRQVVVHGYIPWLARSRRLVNAGLWLTGKPCLQPVGSVLPIAQLAHAAVRDDEPAMWRDLLAAARHQARKRRLDCLLAGCFEDHPAHGVLAATPSLRRHDILTYMIHHPHMTPEQAGVSLQGNHLETSMF